MNSQLQNHEIMLKESIKHFLKSYQNGSSDFSSFESIFFRLIQTMLDPPVEITWFYSAVTFHASKSNSQKNNLSTRVLIARDLLNLLLSCSNLSSASKKIVLLAPVVYELYNILYDFRKKGLNVKSEVEKLLDNIIGYIVMFAGAYDHGNGVLEFDNMAVCFEDLVRVWTADRGGGSLNIGENLKMFFPVFSDGIWRGMSSKSAVQELVGIVLCEVFLLRLCLSFGSGATAEELLTDTKYLAVQTIKAIRNFYFLVSDPCLSEEIGSVVEELVCYISICCSQYLDGGKQGLNSLGEYFVDLLRVWTLDHVREGHDSDILATFFPILKKEFRLEIISCPGYLAGAVMNETFLLRMCLKIPRVLNQEDSQRYMLSVAIQTIKGFQNFHFIDMLLRTLLEPSLPVTALLCSEDACLLQKVLYDAVVLVDYSFYFGRWSHSADSHSKKLALLWLLVADRAIQFARSTNDQATAVKYLNAFGESQIVTEIIKWARIQAGIKEPNCMPNNLTPPVLIEWLLILEDQGIRIFDGASFLRAKALVSKSRMESSWPYLMIDGKNNDGYTLACDAVVNKDQGMGNPSNNTFCLMSPGFDSGKKRKEAFCDPRGSQVKHAKHDSLGSSNTKGKLSPFSRGNEVIIIVSDDDMEDE